MKHIFLSVMSIMVITVFYSCSGSQASTRKNEVNSLESNSQSLTYTIVDTNQNKFYNNRGEISKPEKSDSFYGQDGSYKGNAPSYQDNGDGTISDLNTGLMWHKSFRKVTWKNSESDAQKDKTGGYSDWRVPTIKELYSLILFNGSTGSGMPGSSNVPSDAVPYIATNYFDFEYGTGRRYIDAQFITKTSYVSRVMKREQGFFGVNFADGRIKCYPKVRKHAGNSYYAIYVRGNSEYGKNKYVDNGDGTVSDTATGLMWMQNDSGDNKLMKQLSGFVKDDGSMNWEEAIKFCENLTYNGKSDWRLPTAKELQSIVDYSRSPATTDSPAIDPVFKTTPISDEGGNKNYPFFWSSTTHLDGRNIGSHAVYVAFGEGLGFFKTRRSSTKELIDVHGAGCQRSDPKTGDPSRFKEGRGPQGDVVRIFNFVRPVRDIE